MKNLLRKEIPTNINNTNYYNNYNNLTTNNNTNHCWSLEDQNNGCVNETASLSLGRDQKDNVSHSEGVKKLPAAWKWAKWDLFQNGLTKSGMPSLKLKLNFENKRTAKKYTYASALNTLWESGRMAYGVDKVKWKEDYHWKMVKKHYHSIKNLYSDVRASKLVEPYKGAPTEVAVFVYQDNNTWCVDMILNGDVYFYTLDGSLNEAQIASRQIATAKVGSQGKKMLTLEQGGFV